MGTFRIEIEAVGGHGCQREAKEGDVILNPCRRQTCPDCVAAEFVETIARKFGSGAPVKAAFRHWPGQPSEVVDEISSNGYTTTVKRVKGHF